MENEGIMALPGMQSGRQGGSQLPAVSSADAYNAATEALELSSPGAAAPYRQSIRNQVGGLNLTPQQIGQMVMIVEFLLQDPGKYKEKLGQLVRSGIIKEGQFPAEFDAALLGTILVVLQESRMMQSEGAAPPEMPGMPPIQMAEGGLASVAQYLQGMGRNGDTMLAHITPEEAALLKQRGGAGTINPETGLPEFFNLKRELSNAWEWTRENVIDPVVDTAKKIVSSPVGKIVATVGLATVLGPAGLAVLSTPMAAMAAGATVGGLTSGLKGALVGGALGYIGGGGDFAGFSPMASLQSGLAGMGAGAVGSALNTGLAYGTLGTGAGLALGMNPRDALKMGAISGLGAGALQGFRGAGLTTAAPGAGAAGQPADLGPEPSPIQQAAAAGTQAGMQDVAIPGLEIQSPDLGGGIGAIGTADELLMADLVNQGDFSGIPTADLQAPISQATRGATVTIDGKTYDIPEMSTQPYSETLDARELMRAQGMENIRAGGTFNQPALTGKAAAGAGTGGGTGVIDRVKNFIDNPSFDNFGKVLVDSDATTFIGKYGPGLAIAGAGLAATGAFKQPEPDMAAAANARRPFPTPDPSRGTFATPAAVGSNVLVPTQGVFPGNTPAPTPPVYLPTGITNQPQGVVQPYNMPGLYNVPRQYREGGTAEYPRKTGAINGPGTGTSDSIPAMLSDGEFVFTAKAVRNAGGGSRRKGAKRMYKLMRALESGGMVRG